MAFYPGRKLRLRLWTDTDKFGWLDSSSECTWNRVVKTDYSQGVFCDSANMVIAIDLQNQNLSGSIPKEIGSLTKLRKCYIFERWSLLFDVTY